MYIQMLYICKIFLEELIFILNKNLEQHLSTFKNLVWAKKMSKYFSECTPHRCHLWNIFPGGTPTLPSENNLACLSVSTGTSS